MVYPFGFGLSDSTFAYSGLNAAPKEVSFTITNTGGCPAAEVAQAIQNISFWH